MRSVPLLGITLAAIFLITACADGSGPPPSPTPPPNPTPVATDRVKMQNTQFTPRVIKVRTGTTVKWTNLDAIEHTVTPVDKVRWDSLGSGDAPTQWLKNNDSWSFTFTKPGEYLYYCILHAAPDGSGGYIGMTGKVIVE